MTKQQTLPVLPLQFTVLFPGQALPIIVESPLSVRAVEAAQKADSRILAVAKKNDAKNIHADDLYDVGVIAKLGPNMKGPSGVYLILQGLERATVTRYIEEDETLFAAASATPDMPPLDVKDPAFEALYKETRARARELGKLRGVPDEAVDQLLKQYRDPASFIDQISALMEIPVEDKQTILETREVESRMRAVLLHLQRRIGMYQTQEQIQSQVQEELGARQREMYLREQLKAIKKELGEDDSQSQALDDLRSRLAETDLPDEAQKEVDRELRRLEHAAQGSSEAQVIRTYLEWIAELPWNSRSKDDLDLKRAAEILDEDHYGLKDVKDRVLEYLAVRHLKEKTEKKSGAKGPILLFAGPPGVGKTSIAKSIARAMGREYARVALGGARDEADIRGHRRTYVGAMPGRILQGLKQAGTKNPVFLLDEVDKLGISLQGDPASALMEVLDPAQNDSFTDHYLNVPFDLSEVLFVATANFVQAIPPPLLDRMELIEFTGYTEREKAAIATQYLIPRQLDENALDGREIKFSDESIGLVISEYTHESGVRQLERQIGKLARKMARKIATEKTGKISVTEETVRDLLGRPRIRRERAGEEDEVGVATGMYYTPAGGDIMFVEASMRELDLQSADKANDAAGLGNVSLILTGQLGDVMKESARAALTYATTHAIELGIPARYLKAIETHIHVPAGAIPKDGPSAGVTIATALASALSGRPVRKELSMTGEITLRGRVLPIGGVKEKVLGAHRAGIRHVILPEENRPDLEDIPEDVHQSIEFHFVESLDDVFEISLLPSMRASKAPLGTILRTGIHPIQISEPNA